VSAGEPGASRTRSDFGAALEARDVERAIGLLTDDVVFRSPVVFAPYHGREAVAPVIRAVAAVFEDFRYTGDHRSTDGTSEALPFVARIGERTIEGCDLVTWHDGSVSELVVMVRPLSGALALAEAMRLLLA
jgi:hypothetical protein